MITIEKTHIDPSDLVVVNKVVYRADLRTANTPCSEECHLFDFIKGKCPGTCYRYANFDDIVFRYIMPVGMLAEDAPVVVTPTWRVWDDKIAEIIKKAAYDRKKARLGITGEGKRGPKPGSHYKTKPTVGNIYEDKGRNRWVACIQFEGKVYKRSSKDKLVCEAWLKERRAEFGIGEGGRHV